MGSGQEIVSIDEHLLKVDDDELSVKNFKSVFYQLTAKPDSTTRVFPKDVLIEIEDIFSLNERVVEKLSVYPEAGFLINVLVKFVNGKNKSFCSWDAFSKHQWYESEAISNVVITWEFNAILSQYKVPQKHTLTVKMSNSMRPEELLNIIFTGNMDELDDLDKNFFPVVARVDFIDRVLGDELLNIVADWDKGLRDSSLQKSPYILFLKKNKAKFLTFLSFITNILVMCASIVGANKFIHTLGIVQVGEMTCLQMLAVINTMFACAAIWIFSRRLISSLTDRIFERLREYGESCIFNITKGDRNRQEKLQKREKKSKINVLIDVAFTVIIDIISTIITTLLF
ncbi:hypothetical protein [Enterocloster bolteae]|uniref:hypothetical protein n=1 Tax=Enterocloster bolteae TaxID=208479 RepID=UPI0032202CE8